MIAREFPSPPSPADTLEAITLQVLGAGSGTRKLEEQSVKMVEKGLAWRFEDKGGHLL